MKETSNDKFDPFHHDQLPNMRFSLDLPQVIGVGDSRISNLGCSRLKKWHRTTPQELAWDTDPTWFSD